MISKRRLVVGKREVDEKRRNEIGRRWRNVLFLLFLLVLPQLGFIFKSESHKFSSIGGSDLEWSMVSSFSSTANIVKGVEWTPAQVCRIELSKQVEKMNDDLIDMG